MTRALSAYEERLSSLGDLPSCLSYPNLEERGLLKEKHWRFGVLMAAATSLPLLYRVASPDQLLKVVCAKASISTSTKLLDNLNDRIHSYQEAVHALAEYKVALSEGVYTANGNSPIHEAEHSALEIATWVPGNVEPLDSCFPQDVDLLVSGQVASLAHKTGRYPSMREYLSRVCERSIGNVWIDVDLSFLKEKSHIMKKGNDLIFKSYLVYDDVQDIFEDVRTNSVNCAVIMGLERGVLSESEVEQLDRKEVIHKLGEHGIFQEMLCLGDLIFLKGLEVLSQCDCPVDRGGLFTSLKLVRMFNIRKILSREKDLTTMNMFLANVGKIERVRSAAPDHLKALVECVG